MSQDLSARDVLEKSIAVIREARTHYFEGTVTAMTGVSRRTYYMENRDGWLRSRVESSATVRDQHFHTTFVKDSDGIWDVMSNQAVEVSGVFTEDQLFGIHPFKRFFRSSKTTINSRFPGKRSMEPNVTSSPERCPSRRRPADRPP